MMNTNTMRRFILAIITATFVAFGASAHNPKAWRKLKSDVNVFVMSDPGREGCYDQQIIEMVAEKEKLDNCKQRILIMIKEYISKERISENTTFDLDRYNLFFDTLNKLKQTNNYKKVSYTHHALTFII